MSIRYKIFVLDQGHLNFVPHILPCSHILKTDLIVDKWYKTVQGQYPANFCTGNVCDGSLHTQTHCWYVMYNYLFANGSQSTESYFLVPYQDTHISHTFQPSHIRLIRVLGIFRIWHPRNINNANALFKNHSLYSQS